MRKQNGLSLVELMISTSLSLILLGLLFSLYLLMQNQIEQQASLTAVHDNARSALQILSAEIQAAGYVGCPQLRDDFPLHNATSYVFNNHNKFQVRIDDRGSAVITVRHRSMQASQSVSAGDIMLISDCRHGEIFPAEQTGSLYYRYAEYAERGLLEVNTYFVARTKRGVYALYMRDLHGRKRELVEGIERVRVEGDKGVSIAVFVRDKRLSKTEYGFVVRG